MKYKKIFSVLFATLTTVIMLLSVIFMIICNSNFSNSFPLKRSLLSFKTILLDTMGVEEFDNVYRTDDRLIRVSNTTNLEITQKNIDTILKISENTDTPIYFALVPSAEYIQRAELNRRSLVWNQGKYIDDVYYNVIEKTNIIDITETLINCSENNIYFKTSDHISARGGYYIFQTVMRKLGNQVEKIQKYDIEYFTNSYYGELSNVFWGSGISDTISFYRYPFFRRDLIMSITNGQGESTVYKDVYCKDKEGLDAYMGGKNPITVINNAETFSNKLLVLADSTFNVSAGFFVDYFNEITVINPLAFDKRFEKIDMDKYDYVLILFETDTFNNDDLHALLNMVE